jgi:hypothetical protein
VPFGLWTRKFGTISSRDLFVQVREKLIAPFELRTAFSRRRFSQLLMMEGLPPAAGVAA